MTCQPTELRVAFESDDQTRNLGMWSLLEEVFTQNMGIRLHRITDLSSYSALHFADIYVSVFCAGMEAMCRPEFKSRKKGSLLVVISENHRTDPMQEHLPCQRNSVFLRQTDSLSDMRREIVQAWNLRARSESAGCEACRPVYITESEERVIHYLKQGHLLAEIADLLDISPKKVSAQKRSVMNKFGLHSNAELVVFVTYWQKSESIRRLVPSALPVQKGVNPPRKRRNGGSFLYPQIFSPDNSLRVPLLAKMSEEKTGNESAPGNDPEKMGCSHNPAADKNHRQDKKDVVLLALRYLCGTTSLSNPPAPEEWPRAPHT